jgi:hypothetical protein
VELSDRILKEHTLRITQATVGSNWPGGFIGKDFLLSLQTPDCGMTDNK